MRVFFLVITICTTSILSFSQSPKCDSLKNHLDSLSFQIYGGYSCETGKLDFHNIYINHSGFPFDESFSATIQMNNNNCAGGMNGSVQIDSSHFTSNSYWHNSDVFGWGYFSGYNDFYYLSNVSIGSQQCSSMSLYMDVDFNGYSNSTIETKKTNSCTGQKGEIKIIGAKRTSLDYSRYNCYSSSGEDYSRNISFSKHTKISDSIYEITDPGVYYISEGACEPRQVTVLDKSCGFIDGSLQFDNNNDCRVYRNDFSTGYDDIRFVANKKIVLNPGGYETFSDSKGLFYFKDIPFGTYDLEIIDNEVSNCISTITFSSTKSSYQEYNVKVQLKEHTYIKGYLAIDFDKDCYFDRYYSSKPEHLSHFPINVNNGEFIIYTNSRGEFSALLPNKSYTFSLGDMDSVSNFCNPSLSFPKTIDFDGTDPIVNLDILAQSGEYHETSVQVNDPLLRPGFSSIYTIKTKNTGTFTESGELTAIMSNKISVDGILPIPNYQIGDTLKWDFANIERANTELVTINVTVPDDVTLLGDSALVKTKFVSNSLNEITYDNNMSFSNVIIRGSYDPNDINLTNPGRTSISSILLEDEWLHYRIRFQNTGTFYAQNIYVTDTLPSEINFKSLVMEGASHNYQLTIENNNILRFDFKDILLPAEQDDEPRSHGWIKYKIKQHNLNQIGDTINNKAEIYFDYNPEINTNRTNNPIENSINYYANSPFGNTGLKITAYPNPTQITLFIDGINENISFEIFASTGQKVLEGQYYGNGIDLSSLTAGLYLIKIGDEVLKIIKD